MRASLGGGGATILTARADSKEPSLGGGAMDVNGQQQLAHEIIIGGLQVRVLVAENGSGGSPLCVVYEFRVVIA